jgi:hypothetical protein
MADGRFYDLASQRIRPRNKSQIRSRKLAAGNKLPAICSVIWMGPMARSSSEGFDQRVAALSMANGYADRFDPRSDKLTIDVGPG